MSKLFRAVVLVAALGAVMAAGNLATTAPAQEKKKKATKEEVGITEVYKAKDGWRFRIKNLDGKSVAIGTVGFDTKDEAEEHGRIRQDHSGQGKGQRAEGREEIAIPSSLLSPSRLADSSESANLVPVSSLLPPAPVS